MAFARGTRASQNRTVGLALVVAVSCGYDPPPPNPEIKPSPLTTPGWKEARRYSVSRVLIVEVECADRERAVGIGRAIVQPVTQAYDEVLIYVRPPNRLWTRRVQWRPGEDFRLLDY
jgi:hypothetical protein